jgi:hypothetical protein
MTLYGDLKKGVLFLAAKKRYFIEPSQTQLFQ